MATDETLYREARGGSSEAFTQLYNRYESPLFGFIYKRLKHQQDSEEVFHDAMLSIVNGALTRFEPGGFAPWLYKVAMNLALNRARTRRRKEKNDLNGWQPQPITPADEQLINIERDKILSDGEAQLSSPLSAVYHLRKQGLSHGEIASKLGIPVGTVKSRSSAIVSLLRKEIRKWNVK